MYVLYMYLYVGCRRMGQLAFITEDKLLKN